jgi:hypothetical protein
MKPTPAHPTGSLLLAAAATFALSATPAGHALAQDRPVQETSPTSPEGIGAFQPVQNSNLGGSATESYFAAVGSGYTAGTQPPMVAWNPGRAETDVVSFTGADDEDAERAARWRENLAVMAHLIGKQVYATGGPVTGGYHQALGVPITTQSREHRPKATRLEGFGALFEFQVDYPLRPAADDAAEGSAPAEPPSEWEKARREILAQPVTGAGVVASGGGDWYTGGAGSVVITGAVGAGRMGFAPGQNVPDLDDLRARLVDALKHGANLPLADGEFIAVILRGPGQVVPAWQNNVDDLVGRPSILVRAQPTTLTLRVRKADAQRYAEGQIDAGAFTDLVESRLGSDAWPGRTPAQGDTRR